MKTLKKVLDMAWKLFWYRTLEIQWSQKENVFNETSHWERSKEKRERLSEPQEKFGDEKENEYHQLIIIKHLQDSRHCSVLHILICLILIRTSWDK